MFALTS